MTVKNLLFVALVAFVPGAAGAQQPGAATPAPAATPELPKPAPELKKLDFLVGDWIHAEVYQPSPFFPSGGKGAGRSKASWALGDHHLTVQYKANTPVGILEARGFLGWDAESKAYRMSWFDNMGMAAHYTGQFNAEGVLVLAAEYSFQGQKVKEEFSIKKHEDGKILFTSSMPGPDGVMKPVMESQASRPAAAAPSTPPTN